MGEAKHDVQLQGSTNILMWLDCWLFDSCAHPGQTKKNINSQELKIHFKRRNANDQSTYEKLLNLLGN